MYDSLKKYFEARRNALTYCTQIQSRKSSEDFKAFLNENKQYLSEEQKNALQILHDNINTFSTSKNTNIKTIKDMVNEVQPDE